VAVSLSHFHVSCLLAYFFFLGPGSRVYGLEVGTRIYPSRLPVVSWVRYVGTFVDDRERSTGGSYGTVFVPLGGCSVWTIPSRLFCLVDWLIG